MDQFVARLKNKYWSPVDDMVRDKFVISIRDLQVKERLLREEKLTLEKSDFYGKSVRGFKRTDESDAPKGAKH